MTVSFILLAFVTGVVVGEIIMAKTKEQQNEEREI